jgi:microcystin-dependent protein
MSDQFLAEIRIFTGNFPPYGWAFCNGQILPISQNAALFSLLGTTYGGDGRTTFALPNLQGLVPLGAGSGPGLTPRTLGETGGVPTVTLLSGEMPIHTHTAQGAAAGGQDAPTAHVWGESRSGKTPVAVYAPSGANNTAMSPLALAPAGGNQPHNNLPPYLALNFIIALQGVFPPRG